jgi:hypothetical protein
MSVLSDYLNGCIPATWRKADVVEALHGRVDRGTVYKYLAGSHAANPPEAVLQAFADVLPDANIVELRAAVRVPLGIDTAWQPPAEANRLNAKQRQALDLFIKASVGGPVEEAPGDEAEPLDDQQLSQALDEVRRLRKVRPDLAAAVLERLENSRSHAAGTAPADPHSARSNRPR